jgi:hypothetical protein
MAWFVISSANAQLDDTLKFKGSLALTGIYQTGNIETIIFRAKGDVSIRPWENWEFNTRNSYLYQAFDLDKADEDITSLNFLYYNPEGRYSPVIIGILSSNFRREIELRSIVGAGLNYHILHKKENKLQLALSTEYESTRFARDTFNIAKYDDFEHIRTWRGTFWINGKYYLFKKKTVLSHECYVQPSILDGDNYRWQADVAVEFPLIKYLNFKVNYLHTFESIVVEGQDRQDIFLTFGFTLKSYE